MSSFKTAFAVLSALASLDYTFAAPAPQAGTPATSDSALPATTVYWGQDVVSAGDSGYTISGAVVDSLATKSGVDYDGTWTLTFTSGSLASGQPIPTQLPFTTSAVVPLPSGASTTVVYVEEMPPVNNPAYSLLVEAIGWHTAKSISPELMPLSTLVAKASSDWEAVADAPLWTATVSAGAVITAEAFDGTHTITLSEPVTSTDIYGTDFVVTADPAATV